MTYGLHRLRWKGQVTGPYTLDDLKAMLAAGEVSRAHQVETGSGWYSLGELLQEAPPSEAAKVQEVASGEGGNRVYQELMEERARSLSLQQQFALLREEHARAYEKFFTPPPRRYSRLAITAFILSLCCFIPWLNLITWIPSLVLGYTAQAEMDRDELLDGRGLARAALLITYVFLFLAVVAIFAAMIGWGPLAHGLKLSLW